MANELQSIIKIDDTEYSINAEKAKLADTATNAEKLGGTVASDYAKKSDLFSKNYNDLTNKPTIPTNTNQTIKTGNVTFGANDVVEFVAGSNVTIAGDATNKKITINSTGGGGGTVNNATLTIQKNGANVATFTANSASDVTANITVPTITDSLTSSSTTAALSANQGRVLNEAINGFKKITVSSNDPSGDGDIWFKY